MSTSPSASSPAGDGEGSALQALLTALRARWAVMPTRERRLVVIAVSVVLLYLLWALALAPAVRTLQQAPKRLDTLDAQLQSMQRLAAEARDLRSAVPVAPTQAQAAIRSASERLGDKGRLALQGDRAVLTINGISGEQLRGWLGEVRSGARARPVEATLTRGEQGYSGTLVMALGNNP